MNGEQKFSVMLLFSWYLSNLAGVRTAQLLWAWQKHMHNRHKLKKRKFHLNIRNNPFYPVRVTKHWHRLPREVVSSPLFGGAQNSNGCGPWASQSSWSCLSRWLAEVLCWGLFHPQPFCESDSPRAQWIHLPQELIINKSLFHETNNIMTIA